MAAHIDDIEKGIPQRRRCSAVSSDSDEETPRCSGEESSSSEPEIVGAPATTRSFSSASSCSSCVYESPAEDVVDLESGGGGDGGGEGGGGVVVVVDENKVGVSVNSVKVERDCRICHLSLDASNPDSGLPIELGCSCKEDLAAAHKQCAEAWFKIRGNKTCEICGSTARNVVGVNEAELTDQWNETNETAAATGGGPHHPGETRHFWQGHRFLNFLLACMVFAFVISWLFHFNVPS